MGLPTIDDVTFRRAQQLAAVWCLAAICLTVHPAWYRFTTFSARTSDPSRARLRLPRSGRVAGPR